MNLDEIGFRGEIIEKVYRISDVLQRIGNVLFLRRHLSFSGGTALNLIIFKQVERLSVDLDFNYRIDSDTTDWQEDRRKIDQYMKRIFGDLKYSDREIKINVSYPLTRFDIRYHQNNSFKIEVGYSRRFPLLKQEIEHKFVHPRTLETSRILLPQTEELFGNKCSTLLARRSTRDVYDVANISKVRCQKDLLRKTLVLDNLMQAKANFAKIDIEEYLQAFHVDDRIRHVVRGANISKKEFEEIREIAANFLVQIQDELTDDEKKCLDLFFEDLKFEPSLLGVEEVFHHKLSEHPNILRALQVLK